MIGSSFIWYMYKSKVANLLFVMGFVCAICAYSFWKPISGFFKLSVEQGYQLFFVGIAVAFFFYTFAYFVEKYDRWRWFPMFVYLVCFSRVLFEILNPEEAQTRTLLEYTGFSLTAFIVFGYWIKYRIEKFKKRENEKINRR